MYTLRRHFIPVIDSISIFLSLSVFYFFHFVHIVFFDCGCLWELPVLVVLGTCFHELDAYVFTVGSVDGFCVCVYVM